MPRTATVEVGHYKILFLRVLAASPGKWYSYRELKQMIGSKSLASVMGASHALVSRGLVQAKYVKKTEHYSNSETVQHLGGVTSIRVFSAEADAVEKYLDSFIDYEIP